MPRHVLKRDWLVPITENGWLLLTVGNVLYRLTGGPFLAYFKIGIVKIIVTMIGKDTKTLFGRRIEGSV
jgi:hypothetical protein